MDDAGSFDFSSGALCLDFANTWGNRPDPSGDRLLAYRDLVEWAQQAEILTGAAAASCAREADHRPLQAAAVVDEALRLRETVYRVFSDLAASGDPAIGDIAVLNRGLASAMPRIRLRPGRGCCSWTWSAPEDALDQMLWPVVRSAADLLTSARVARVRECAADDCAWLFIDTSRGPRRKWCDMSTCGNRAKARRHYARHRSSRQ